MPWIGGFVYVLLYCTQYYEHTCVILDVLNQVVDALCFAIYCCDVPYYNGGGCDIVVSGRRWKCFQARNCCRRLMPGMGVYGPWSLSNSMFGGGQRPGSRQGLYVLYIHCVCSVVGRARGNARDIGYCLSGQVAVGFSRIFASPFANSRADKWVADGSAGLQADRPLPWGCVSYSVVPESGPCPTCWQHNRYRAWVYCRCAASNA